MLDYYLQKQFGLFAKINCQESCNVDDPLKCSRVIHLGKKIESNQTIYPILPNTVSVAFFFENVRRIYEILYF